MLATRRLSRRFAWKTVLEVPGYEALIKKQRYASLAKIVGSSVTTFFFFASEWYTLSTFASMVTAALFIKHKTDPLSKNIVFSIEVDDEDKSSARIKTMQGKFRLNIDSVTSLTDIYPAYRALQDSQNLLSSTEQKPVASFDGDNRGSSYGISKENLQNTLNDTEGYMASITQGRTTPYHEFADRFHFFFRQGDNVFAVGFPFIPEVVFDAEELMRVLAGNKPLKPRRSVALAQEDEELALEAQEKTRQKLKGDPLQELPSKGKQELPHTSSGTGTVN